MVELGRHCLLAGGGGCCCGTVEFDGVGCEGVVGREDRVEH